MAEISSSELIRCFKEAAAHLSAHKEEINRLNVFPVPDGDTGTNISLTLQNVVRELDALPLAADVSDVTKAIVHGSLMGARGNSGVITSQILRGICEDLDFNAEFAAPMIATALAAAVEVSFSAVRRPVEGTILTVLRDMATAAASAAEDQASLMDCLERVSDEGFASVRRTPELLPILKENNVVDAGGYGLALLVQGFVAAYAGRPLAQVTAVEPIAGVDNGPKVAIEQINDWEGSDYLYCTEFLLHSDALDMAAAERYLTSIGDCELLVGSHPDFKIHVHTDVPGDVLTYMTERGQVSEVHIHNMQLQSAERLANLAEPPTDAGLGGAAGTDTGGAAGAAGIGASVGAAGTGTASAGAGAAGFGLPAAGLGSADAWLGSPGTARQRGYVAVASGEGLVRILQSLGVDSVVSGGQTMNPSTAELLAAIDAVPAPEVLVFPNNKNIIMAATAAADLSEKTAVVIPTHNVPASFSALFLADPAEPLDDQVAAMNEAIEQLHCAEVTTAIKNAKTAQGEAIHVGDIIGLIDDDIEFVGVDLEEIALMLVQELASADPDSLTLLAGADYADADFAALVARIGSDFPDLELDVHRGEQPLYPLIIAAE